MITPPPPRTPRESTRSSPHVGVRHQGQTQWTALIARFNHHGALATVKWLFAKAVFYRWTAVIFSESLSTERQPSVWPSGYIYSPPICADDLSDAQRHSLWAAGYKELLAQLGGSDHVYWVSHDQTVASVGAIMRNSPQCSVLGLPQDAVLIGHCETGLAHRSKGLYALAINDTLVACKLRGDLHIYMETRPDNTASQKGILRAGLRQDRVVHATILFRSVVIRRDKVEWIKRV